VDLAGGGLGACRHAGMNRLKTVRAMILAIAALTRFGKIRQKIAESAFAKAAAAADNKDPGLSLGGHPSPRGDPRWR
jgi:hypothetical protein